SAGVPVLPFHPAEHDDGADGDQRVDPRPGAAFEEGEHDEQSAEGQEHEADRVEVRTVAIARIGFGAAAGPGALRQPDLAQADRGQRDGNVDEERRAPSPFVAEDGDEPAAEHGAEAPGGADYRAEHGDAAAAPGALRQPDRAQADRGQRDGNVDEERRAPPPFVAEDGDEPAAEHGADAHGDADYRAEHAEGATAQLAVEVLLEHAHALRA